MSAWYALQQRKTLHNRAKSFKPGSAMYKLGSQHPSPNVKTLCNVEPRSWPEIITSHDAESTCFNGSGTPCDATNVGIFWPIFGRKSSYHVMDASCFAIEVALYRMGRKPARRKNPGKMGKKMENGPGPGTAENGCCNGKNGPRNGHQNPFWGSIFPFRRPFFAHFGPGAIFHFLLIFLGFLRRAGFPFCIWSLRSQFLLRNAPHDQKMNSKHSSYII